jgi:hypothetical protein
VARGSFRKSRRFVHRGLRKQWAVHLAAAEVPPRPSTPPLAIARRDGLNALLRASRAPPRRHPGAGVGSPVKRVGNRDRRPPPPSRSACVRAPRRRTHGRLRLFPAARTPPPGSGCRCRRAATVPSPRSAPPARAFSVTSQARSWCAKASTCVQSVKSVTERGSVGPPVIHMIRRIMLRSKTP